MPEIVYKTVRRKDEDTFISLFAHGKAETIYRVGQISEPPYWLAEIGHGLFAFDSLKDAIRIYGTGYDILACEAGDKLPLPPDCFLSCLAEEIISPVWRGFIGFGYSTFSSLKPIRYVSMTEREMIYKEVNAENPKRHKPILTLGPT